MHILRACVDRALPECGAKDPAQMSALNLAYIGDTVYDLFVRTYLVERMDAKVHQLHLLSAQRVCAAGQATAARLIEPLLCEEELGVYKRGRNAHMGTVAKNQSIVDYRTATGLEALMGYLYLKGNDARLIELMRIIFEKNEVNADA